MKEALKRMVAAHGVSNAENIVEAHGGVYAVEIESVLINEGNSLVSSKVLSTDGILEISDCAVIFKSDIIDVFGEIPIWQLHPGGDWMHRSLAW